MRVAIPHDLPKDEVRRRLRESRHDIADHLPGGVAQIATSWASEDRMNIDVSAMGQDLHGWVDIEEHQLVFEVTLPMMLSFLEPAISGAIRNQGQKLLT